LIFKTLLFCCKQILSRTNRCHAPGVGAKEQVPERAPKQIRDPPLHQVVRPVVDHMAALAQTPKITLPVVARIVIEVCSGPNWVRAMWASMRRSIFFSCMH
jgi:hypothetical protein